MVFFMVRRIEVKKLVEFIYDDPMLFNMEKVLSANSIYWRIIYIYWEIVVYFYLFSELDYMLVGDLEWEDGSKASNRHEKGIQ